MTLYIESTGAAGWAAIPGTPFLTVTQNNAGGTWTPATSTKSDATGWQDAINQSAALLDVNSLTASVPVFVGRGVFFSSATIHLNTCVPILGFGFYQRNDTNHKTGTDLCPATGAATSQFHSSAFGTATAGSDGMWSSNPALIDTGYAGAANTLVVSMAMTGINMEANSVAIDAFHGDNVDHFTLDHVGVKNFVNGFIFESINITSSAKAAGEVEVHCCESVSNTGSYGTLSANTTNQSNPLTNVATTMTVASSTGFPAAATATPSTYFYVVIDPYGTPEVVQVTNVSGTTWTIARAKFNTAAAAHAQGTVVASQAVLSGTGIGGTTGFNGFGFVFAGCPGDNNSTGHQPVVFTNVYLFECHATGASTDGFAFIDSGNVQGHGIWADGSTVSSVRFWGQNENAQGTVKQTYSSLTLVGIHLKATAVPDIIEGKDFAGEGGLAAISNFNGSVGATCIGGEVANSYATTNVDAASPVFRLYIKSVSGINGAGGLGFVTSTPFSAPDTASTHAPNLSTLGSNALQGNLMPFDVILCITGGTTTTLKLRTGGTTNTVSASGGPLPVPGGARYSVTWSVQATLALLAV